MYYVHKTHGAASKSTASEIAASDPASGEVASNLVSLAAAREKVAEPVPTEYFDAEALSEGAIASELHYIAGDLLDLADRAPENRAEIILTAARLVRRLAETIS